MKGIEVSKNFYNEYGKSMIHEYFHEIEDKLAVGLVGAGSECFGFDDKISVDHDFDPGFCIFIPDDIDDNTKFKLEREYAKLPQEYKGFKRAVMAPVGGNRRGVKRISEFLKEKLGNSEGKLSIYDWFTVPEESLAEFTNGEIWRDDSKVFSNLRLKFLVFPEDIKLKKLAGVMLLMAQSGQYNFERCVLRNEFGTARLAMYEFVIQTIHAVFLLNEVYMPYYKWQFRALRDLSWPKNIENRLEKLLHISDEQILSGNISKEIDYIASIFVERLKFDKLTKKDDLYLEKQAYEINNCIKDNEIRNMHILAAV